MLLPDPRRRTSTCKFRRHRILDRRCAACRFRRLECVAVVPIPHSIPAETVKIQLNFFFFFNLLFLLVR